MYRYKDGKAVVTPVTIGASDATHTVIRSGLSPDDRVVTGPYKALEQLEHDQEIVDERESSSETPATEPAKTQPVDNSTGGAAASAGPA